MTPKAYPEEGVQQAARALEKQKLHVVQQAQVQPISDACLAKMDAAGQGTCRKGRSTRSPRRRMTLKLHRISLQGHDHTQFFGVHACGTCAWLRRSKCLTCRQKLSAPVLALRVIPADV